MMPNQDGTGPKGQGPKDGHGKGKGKGSRPGQGPMAGGKKGRNQKLNQPEDGYWAYEQSRERRPKRPGQTCLLLIMFCVPAFFSGQIYSCNRVGRQSSKSKS